MSAKNTLVQPASVAVAPSPQMPPERTPDNTPVPGGGSWHWDYSACCWQTNTPDQPLQPGDIGALQTTTPTQE